MSAVDTLDEALLASYLEANIEEFKGPLTASKFAGGQSNPTFKIDAASGSYVLRRQPPGKLLKSAHAVDREYRVLAALADTDVPVAKVYHLCEDSDVIGSMFYIMEFCEGNVHWESSLEDISSNQLRAKMYDEMSRVMAAIHSVDLDKVGLSDYGRPGNYFQRQYDRWSSQYKASELKPIPEMDQVIEWLGKNIPEDDGRVSLVHGDYRLDNLMFSSDNERVIAVLDWELSTLGHPYADLAYQCMGMRLPSGNGPGASSGLLGIDSDALGIPSEKDYIASYCQRMGIDKLDNWNFYLAFSFFRLAAIAQGVAKRAADGNASSKAAGGIATMVQPIAANALAIINEQ
ncbi:phosphotransferase family protein [SAR92 clade bacterium H231]|jgi:aminoglycoside phosphotransferase (APT) family kinase protein|nr:phosphotransferase family protein [Porticoccaceae bacterium]MCT2532036.1 phosphotransferase family protein [SAR92 clade bacterium H231]MDB2547654.1 phosphotransferase family protein [Porticoccaceae bacterium]MDC0953275.1 phosphotransferase family protein [Porticoccaceae bacterium]MDG1200646.1 phosphotransferase family protein [Porticoccaceae bacterium]